MKSAHDKSFTTADVDVLDTSIAYQGFYTLEKLRLKHRLFSGDMGPEITRELMVRQDAVCVLPYDPDTDEVILLEQFRVGALSRLTTPWLFEVVAGLMDKPDEDPESVAHREAFEEAGLILSRLIPICRYYPSPGGSSQYVYLYLGLCQAHTASSHAGLADEGEDIQVHRMVFSEALDYMRDGHINNAASLIALQWLALNHHQWR